MFETGVRAILGQQVTVQAALNYTRELVHQLGRPAANPTVPNGVYFPAAERVIDSDLAFLRMPAARKATLKRLADHMLNSSTPTDIDAWQSIKGIGPWTCNYVRLRALKDPDVWLAQDAGIRNALAKQAKIDWPQSLRPWRSYATLQLWQQPST